MNADKLSKLQSRLDFVGLDEESLERFAQVQPLIDAHLDEAMDALYDKMRQTDAVSHHFSDTDHYEKARNLQVDHWKTLAAGSFDDDYYQSCQAIGRTHAKIGMDVRWYVDAYAIIAEKLIGGMLADFMVRQPKKPLFGRGTARADEISPEAFSAGLVGLIKAMFIDVDVAMSSFVEQNQAEADDLHGKIVAVAEAAKVGDFTLRLDFQSNDLVIEGLGEAVDELMETVNEAIDKTDTVLKALADADLTKRMEGRHYGVFADLQANTNTVVDRLTEIIGRLRQTSRGVKNATGEILTGANDLSERTTKQAATIEETSAAMEQLANTVMENAKRAGSASEQAKLASHTAEEGGEVMSQANQAMERISSSSSKISNIIGMIDDIAFQTNLLALNASVEAARAGEAGKGFAVVAVEVRRLAQSAAEASSEVKTLIEQSGEEVSGGTRLVAEAAEKLSSLLEAVRTNAVQMEEIAKDSGEQAGSIEEVNIAVRQMDEMTQHNAALVEETNAAIEQTESEATELDRIVDIFTLADARQARQEPAPAASSDSTSVNGSAAMTSPTAKSYLSQGNAALESDWSAF